MGYCRFKKMAAGAKPGAGLDFRTNLKAVKKDVLDDLNVKGKDEKVVRIS